MNFHPRLSLVAQFDDINRLTEQLGMGVETEFMTFVKGQENLRRDLNNALKMIEKKEKELVEAKKTKVSLELKLQHARSLIESEINKRIKVEQDKSALERQIALVREVLLTDPDNVNGHVKEKLAFLDSQPFRNNVSLSRLTPIEESMGLSLSDLSFDQTEDDLEIERNLLRDKHKDPYSSRAYKKKKYNEDDEVSDSPNVDIKTDFEITSQPITTRLKRYDTEPVPNSQIPPSPHITLSSKNDPLFFRDEPANLNSDKNLSENITPRRYSSSSKMNRNHTFCTKTIIRPETCLPCNTRIGFYKQALKCQDCRVTCHPDCKNNVPLPCYPLSHTPTSKRQMGTISDFVPNNPPLIPAILVHCINEIELRGLEETGLYRVPGSEKEVRELKDKFLKGKCVPCLSKIDIHAICGTVKEFLRSLTESLITRNLWRNFVNASKIANRNDNDGTLCDTINKLPIANRDTLAYLILHLHRVAQSSKCRMPIENLAKVFAPTIIGYSSNEPTNILSETDLITVAMHSLLKLPSSFWEKFICIENSQKESSANIDSNRLGPISGSVLSSTYKSRTIRVGKTPMTPRHETGVRTRPKKPFFASPMLK